MLGLTLDFRGLNTTFHIYSRDLCPYYTNPVKNVPFCSFQKQKELDVFINPKGELDITKTNCDVVYPDESDLMKMKIALHRALSERHNFEQMWKDAKKFNENLDIVTEGLKEVEESSKTLARDLDELRKSEAASKTLIGAEREKHNREAKDFEKRIDQLQKRLAEKDKEVDNASRRDDQHKHRREDSRGRHSDRPRGRESHKPR